MMGVSHLQKFSRSSEIPSWPRGQQRYKRQDDGSSKLPNMVADPSVEQI
jgi:hypothetical protein